MGQPLICADNLFNRRMYPSHTVTANEQGTGFETYRAADGRRDALDYWSPTTLNNDAWLKVTCDRTRAATFVALDRGHNLAGKTIRLECSNDDFTTTETVVSITLPAASAPGSLDDTLGVRTEEGAWVKRFSLRAAKYWRWYVPAMGVGLKPQVVGLYLGLAFAPNYFNRPLDDDGDVLVVTESQSELGWIGRGPQGRQRQGVIQYEFLSFSEYEEQARLHLRGFFGNGRPTWIVFDDAAAQKAVLAIRQNSPLGFPYPTGGGARETDLPWVEYEALIP